MIRHNAIKIIVLDFDNCIVLNENGEGSEEIKDRAWFDVFSEYDPAILTPVLNEEKLKVVGGRGDRKNIVEQLLKRFGYPEAMISAEAISRCDRFNEIVQNGIKQINISNAVREGIALLSAHFPLYINTATPRENAIESLQSLGIYKFFKNVYGRPGTKVDNLKSIAAEESIGFNKILFVDDQPGGYKAALEVGCQFIGIRTKRNKLWQDQPQPFLIINSLAELTKML